MAYTYCGEFFLYARRKKRAPLCSQTEMERAVELRIRAFWCNPGMLPFLRSRGSGGKVAEKQFCLGTMSSVMETLTHQLEGF